MSKMTFALTLFCVGSLVNLEVIHGVDMSALSVHPACFVALTLTSLRIEPSRTLPTHKSNFVVNVSGRLLMVNQQDDNQVSSDFNKSLVSFFYHLI